MTKRGASTGEAGRYVALASEMVVLTIIGLFLGQALGQKIGAPFETIGIIFGALIGFIIGTYSVYKTIERIDKRSVVHIGKRMCPECLRGIPVEIKECPYCGYRRNTEE